MKCPGAQDDFLFRAGDISLSLRGKTQAGRHQGFPITGPRREDDFVHKRVCENLEVWPMGIGSVVCRCCKAPRGILRIQGKKIVIWPKGKAILGIPVQTDTKIFVCWSPSFFKVTIEWGEGVLHWAICSMKSRIDIIYIVFLSFCHRWWGILFRLCKERENFIPRPSFISQFPPIINVSL